MIVYIESNFILEIAFLQGENQYCDDIMNLASSSTIDLVLPSYSIGEPYETLIRRRKSRKKRLNQFNNEIIQLSRSKPYKKPLKDFDIIRSLIITSIEEEKKRLNTTLEQILGISEIISIKQEIIESAIRYQTDFDFPPQDSIVYSSILDHLSNSDINRDKCFITRNPKDFSSPDIVDQLKKYNCEIHFNFKSGLNYIQHKLGST